MAAGRTDPSIASCYPRLNKYEYRKQYGHQNLQWSPTVLPERYIPYAERVAELMSTENATGFSQYLVRGKGAH